MDDLPFRFCYTPKAFFAALLYLGYFFKQLMKTNLRLAKIVVTPSLPITPGFVKVRTTLTIPIGLLLLMNSITLCPGSLTEEMEYEWLYAHWVTMGPADAKGATQQIVAGFERYLEAMSG